jgi:hypothetical protein
VQGGSRHDVKQDDEHKNVKTASEVKGGDHKKTILLYSPDLNFCFSLSMLFQDRFNVITTTNLGMLDKLVADYSADLSWSMPSHPKTYSTVGNVAPGPPSDHSASVYSQGCEPGPDDHRHVDSVFQTVWDPSVSKRIEKLLTRPT